MASSLSFKPPHLELPLLVVSKYESFSGAPVVIRWTCLIFGYFSLSNHLQPLLVRCEMRS
jgi:hypothetical protein